MKEAELARTAAQVEQARKKKKLMVLRITNSINDVNKLLEQFNLQDEKDTKRTIGLVNDNTHLKTRIVALEKELMNQKSRADRMEEELREQVAKNQSVIHGNDNIDMAAEDDGFAERNRKNEERMIPMSTVISFCKTRMTGEAVQTLADLLYFALQDRTAQEEAEIKGMMDAFKTSMRPQMDVKDSTQNFYLK